MVQVWYLESDGNQLNEPKFISLEELFVKTGIEYFQLNINTYETDGVLDKLRKERGYNYEDELACSMEGPGRDEEKLKAFFTEHLHADEEIRFFLEGSGNFDVRDDNDQWIRVMVVPGDLIILPGGIYHRFCMNSDVRMKRIFSEEPVWKAYNRPADDLAARKTYVEKLQNGSFFAQPC